MKSYDDGATNDFVIAEWTDEVAVSIRLCVQRGDELVEVRVRAAALRAVFAAHDPELL